jgi:hypothetical protein
VAGGAFGGIPCYCVINMLQWLLMSVSFVAFLPLLSEFRWAVRRSGLDGEASLGSTLVRKKKHPFLSIISVTFAALRV